MRREGGEERSLLVNSEPLTRPGDSAPYGVISSFADITDVDRAHEELRALAENTRDFIVRYDRDGRRLYANPALVQAHGLPTERLLGRQVDTPPEPGDALAFEPESARLVREKIQEVFEQGSSPEFEVVFDLPDGPRTMHCRLVPEYDRAGRVTDVLAVGRDMTQLKRMEQELAERERRYRAVFDNARDEMFLMEVSPDGQHFRNLESNPAVERSTGRSRSELAGKEPAEVFGPEAGEVMTSYFRCCVQEGLPIQDDGAELPLASGRRLFDITLVPTRDATGRVHRIVGVSRDITEVRAAERALADSEKRFRLAFDDSLVGMALLGVDGEPRFRYGKVNPAMCEFLGLGEQDLLGMRQTDVLSPNHAVMIETTFEALLSGDLSSYRGEHGFRRSDGEAVWGLVGAIVVRDDDGAPLYLLSQVEDITARKRAEDQLVHQALHDDLTGLPNRALLLEHLGHALARSRRNHSVVGVLFVDLDGFKSINDSLGHAAGDEFLSWVAARLSAVVRASDTAARVGGDEFVVVCEGLHHASDAAVVADQIQRALNSEIPLEGHVVTAGASIGIALSDGGSTPESLLRDADAAMYVAKKRGGRCWEAADPAQQSAAMRTLSLEAELRRGLERREFVVHYQPVIDLRSGRVVSLEALVRWQHPERGLVQPGGFIDVAEQRGLIGELGAWVLRTACTQAAAWYQRYGDAAPSLAVNVSSRQLGNHCMSDHVNEVLDVYPLPADHLYLEVTESQLLVAGTSSTIDLRTVAERGVRIAIDDFGTGHSGFDYLRRLPVDELKIDRSFVDGVGTDPTHTAITASVVALGLNLGLTVVAEGIERPEQVRALRGMGCPWGQGWLWHPALPPEDVDSLLAAPHATPEARAHLA